MSVQIVQDDMDLAARMFGYDAVDEVQELDTPAALVMAGFDQAGGDVQRRKQGRRAMAFVGVAEAGERLAVALTRTIR